MPNEVSLPPSGDAVDEAFREALGSSPAAPAAAPAEPGTGEAGETGAKPVDKESEAAQEGSTETGEKPGKPDDETGKPDGKPEEGKPTAFKVGNKEFAKPEDAVAEANRIHGRNADLAGKLKDAERNLADYKSASDARIAELEAANKAWEEWHREQKGEAPATKAPDADSLAAKTAENLDRISTEREAKKAMAAEVAAIQALPNYGEIEDIFTKLSDKINPITDKHFTPKEAYSYACKELGLENLLEKKPETKPAEPPAAKPPAPAAQRQAAPAAAAARPAAKPAAAPAPAKAQRDFADRMLDGDI